MRALLMFVNSQIEHDTERRKAPLQQRSREMVDRILDAATRVFTARGYHKTTTNHVAEEAGASIGSLYQYFPNKDSLLAGIAERHVAELMEEISLVAAQIRNAEPDVETVCRTLVTVAADMNRPSELHRLLWDAPRSPELTEVLADLDRLLISEVAWHLQRLGHAKGREELRATVLVAAATAAIHAVPASEARDDELVKMCIGLAEAR